jgi:hypothetical protein
MPKPKFLLKEAGGGKNKQKKKGRHQHSVSEIYFAATPTPQHTRHLIPV